MRSREVEGSIIFRKERLDNEAFRKRINETKTFIKSSMKVNGVVVLALPRTVELMCSMFALLELEIPFLIVDISLPLERLAYMISSANAVCTLTFSDLKYSFKTNCILFMDTHEALYLDECEVPMEHQFKEKVAYILYTSGTTGKPKAVVINRRGLFNFVDALPMRIPLTHETILCSFSIQSFDAFILESVAALYNGATVILSGEEQRSNPKSVKQLLEESKPNTLQMTPTLLRLIENIDAELTCLNSVQYLLVGGEKFPDTLLKKLQEVTDARIFNLYGPTETTVYSTIADVTVEKSVHIGEPIANTEIYLLSDDLEVIEQGEIGEICIAGEGLAQGYLNNIEQTQRAFVKLNSEPCSRVYRTGDLGKVNEEGKLVCLGRLDEQIKLFGRRIELDDIDANLREIGIIEDCVTCFAEEAQMLVTFYLSSTNIEEALIISKLKEKIPTYMLPNKFIQVTEFVYTASGKMNRKLMLETFLKDSEVLEEDKESVTDTNDIATCVLGIFEEQLGRKLTLDASLEELVISSFLFIIITVEIEEKLNIEFENERLVKEGYATINDVASYVKSRL